jgi:hypothetical protein
MPLRSATTFGLPAAFRARDLSDVRSRRAWGDTRVSQRPYCPQFYEWHPQLSAFRCRSLSARLSRLANAPQRKERNQHRRLGTPANLFAIHGTDRIAGIQQSQYSRYQALHYFWTDAGKSGALSSSSACQSPFVFYRLCPRLPGFAQTGTPLALPRTRACGNRFVIRQDNRESGFAAPVGVRHALVMRYC